MKKSKSTILGMNAVFAIVSISVLIFLLNAPEETTSALPKDDDHIKLYGIKGKKAAEKYCAECHDPGAQAPLPDGHPPKYRCLFCHKRN